MKAIFVGIILALAVAEISAGTGYYTPKGFFTIDQNGQPSPLHHISNAHQQALERFRRSPQGGYASSSSSSSSSTYGDGGPVYFQQETAVHSSGPGGLSSRFGGDSGGHYTKTSGVIDADGKVYYNTRNGKY